MNEQVVVSITWGEILQLIEDKYVPKGMETKARLIGVGIKVIAEPLQPAVEVRYPLAERSKHDT